MKLSIALLIVFCGIYNPCFSQTCNLSYSVSLTCAFKTIKLKEIKNAKITCRITNQSNYTLVVGKDPYIGYEEEDPEMYFTVYSYEKKKGWIPYPISPQDMQIVTDPLEMPLIKLGKNESHNYTINNLFALYRIEKPGSYRMRCYVKRALRSHEASPDLFQPSGNYESHSQFLVFEVTE